MARAKRRRTIETDIFGYEVLETPINSKRKGNTNEVAAAKWMQRWTGVGFTRTPSSGGLRWQDTANVCGDIVCEVQSFHVPVAVETKHLKSVTFTLWLRSNSGIFTIYRQAKEDADRANKKPMMMLRKNGMKAGTYMIYFDFPLVGIQYESYGESDGVCLWGYSSETVLENMPYKKFVGLVQNL